MKYNIVKYGLVGLTGEFIYFILYRILTLIGLLADQAVLISGGLCIILNSYGHAKFSFNTKYTYKFATGYIGIQLSCLILNYFLANYLDSNDFNYNLIGVITIFVWFLLSYLLCRLFLIK